MKMQIVATCVMGVQGLVGAEQLNKNAQTVIAKNG